MLRRPLLRAAALLSLLPLMAVGRPASATILTFDGLGLSDWGVIPAGYGDNVTSLLDIGTGWQYGLGSGFTPNVVVDYATVGYVPYVEFWTTAYGDLTNVAFSAVSGALLEVSLTPDPGHTVTLESFDIAGWPYSDYYNQPLRIVDGAGNTVLDYGLVLAPGNGHATFSPGITSSGALRIQFSSNYNAGIDNIRFSQDAIPEPGLLGAATLAGLGLIGMLRRARS